MKIKVNEYELALIKDKLSLQIKHQFNNVETGYLDDVLTFVIKQYHIVNSAVEKAFVLSYDINGELTGIMQIGLGDHCSVDFNLNAAFKFLLLNNAMGCIFIHSHPSDADVTPSTDDYVMDGTINSLCSTLKIDMLADLIIQDYKEYYNITKGERMGLVL